jgi:hypothetical protein
MCLCRPALLSRRHCPSCAGPLCVLQETLESWSLLSLAHYVPAGRDPRHIFIQVEPPGSGDGGLVVVTDRTTVCISCPHSARCRHTRAVALSTTDHADGSTKTDGLAARSYLDKIHAAITADGQRLRLRGYSATFIDLPTVRAACLMAHGHESPGYGHGGVADKEPPIAAHESPHGDSRTSTRASDPPESRASSISDVDSEGLSDEYSPDDLRCVTSCPGGSVLVSCRLGLTAIHVMCLVYSDATLDSSSRSPSPKCPPASTPELEAGRGTAAMHRRFR